MKAPPITQLVFNTMFPKPKASDPQDFDSVLTRYLIYEVRQEVHAFYGHLETQEAKYPGLDYNHPTHRIRLCRWQWHRRLFRAIDALRLTNNEVANLTRWEGTRWAKERFEKEQGIVIRDTSADGIPHWVEPEQARRREARISDLERMVSQRSDWVQPEYTFESAVAAARARTSGERTSRAEQAVQALPPHLNPLTSDNVLSDFDFDSFLHDEGSERPAQAPRRTMGVVDVEGLYVDDGESELSHGADVGIVEAETEEIVEEASTNLNTPNTEEDDDEDDDGELRSIGVSLNEQLRERVAAHNAGDTSLPIDEAWELWLKHALETGELEQIARQVASADTAETSPPVAGSSRSGGSSGSGQQQHPSTADMTRALGYQPYLFTATLFETARAGNWADVPEFLHDMFRRRLSGEEGGHQGQQQQRRQYSDLRLPVTSAAPDIRVQRRAQRQA